MALLTQFLLRLSFGLAGGMALVSPRQVSSGYFRNHLYVVLGLSSLAALVSRAATPPAFAWAVATAAASYVGAVCWLYERPRIGRALLAATAALALVAALLAGRCATGAAATPSGAQYLWPGQTVTAGLLLGVTMAAMLLGHWYLNAPGMELKPLRRLLAAMGVAVVLHATVSGIGLGLELGVRETATAWWLFVAMRWTFGLAGVAILAWMAWRTLDIPNTQSATGILYVAVIGAFVGETMSLLLSAECTYPI
jgi:hypothetical protein